jgi:hypothetical protein
LADLRDSTLGALRSGGQVALGRASTLAPCLALAVSCTSALEPRTVALPDPSITPATYIHDITSYPVAGATIGGLLEQELGIPRFPVALRFFPTPEDLELTLLQLGHEPRLARETSRNLKAVGGYRGVLLNESKLVSLSWPDRVALLAHEMTHTVQYELGGGRRGTSDQWLREGFADWVSLRLIERLGGARRGELRSQRIMEFRDSGRTWPLADMVTFQQWVALSVRSDGESYLQAYLAADFLIERHSMQAVISYFARFAQSEDRLGNFRAVFGQELPAFEKVLLARLRRL